jgi:hypothetical protein
MKQADRRPLSFQFNRELIPCGDSETDSIAIAWVFLSKHLAPDCFDFIGVQMGGEHGENGQG